MSDAARKPADPAADGSGGVPSPSVSGAPSESGGQERGKQEEQEQEQDLYSGSSAMRALYSQFAEADFEQLEDALLASQTREEKAFFRALLNLKLQIAQEKIIGEILL